MPPRDTVGYSRRATEHSSRSVQINQAASGGTAHIALTAPKSAHCQAQSANGAQRNNAHRFHSHSGTNRCLEWLFWFGLNLPCSMRPHWRNQRGMNCLGSAVLHTWRLMMGRNSGNHFRSQTDSFRSAARVEAPAGQKLRQEKPSWPITDRLQRSPFSYP